MPRCIYCLDEKAVGEFNREHVVPRALGRFRHSPTLAAPRAHRVCTSCNHLLGARLDIGLARSSWEAVLRLQLGVVPLSRAAKLRYDRLRISLPADHPRAPMLLRFVPSADGKELRTAPMAQLRIAISGGPLQCIPEDRIAVELPVHLAEGEVTRVEMFCWDGDPSAFDRMRDKAILAGLSSEMTWNPIGPDGYVAPELVDAHIQFTIDEVVARAIAKIAYEYFFWVVEPLAPHLIVDTLLQPLRSFILEGHPTDWRTLVVPTGTPLLANETRRLKTTQGHLVALRWDTVPKAPIAAIVSLFNEHTYRVHVSDAPALIWQSLDSGHHFDIRRGDCIRLAAGRFTVPPLGQSSAF